MDKTLTVPVKVGYAEIECMLITARESAGCIDYWCDGAESHVEGKDYYKILGEWGGFWRLHEVGEDGEPGAWHILCRENIIKGLEIMAEKYPHNFKDILTENEDIETADVFIQCCIFGEAKYS